LPSSSSNPAASEARQSHEPPPRRPHALPPTPPPTESMPPAADASSPSSDASVHSQRVKHSAKQTRKESFCGERQKRRAGEGQLAHHPQAQRAPGTLRANSQKDTVGDRRRRRRRNEDATPPEIEPSLESRLSHEGHLQRCAPSVRPSSPALIPITYNAVLSACEVRLLRLHAVHDPLCSGKS
jgi:hypothetical protein